MNNNRDIQSKEEILKKYSKLVKGIDKKAVFRDTDSHRAYGGIIRSSKGTLVEDIAKDLIVIAWNNLEGDPNRLSLEKKSIRVPIKREYVDHIKNPEVKEYILKNIDRYFYPFKTDVHVCIDGDLVLGVECKAYTENAMLKRIMVDFTFLKQTYPKADAVLFQLESQLGGDYSEVDKDIKYGSHTTHTIMSYFDVNLVIITLLEGERLVDKPIHKEGFYKELKESSVDKAISTFEGLLRKRL